MTGPSGVFSSAVTGQADAQAGSSQCMHCCLTNTVWNPAGWFGSSISWCVSSMYVCDERRGGFVSSSPSSGSCVISPSRPFHSLQMTWQALQPTHFFVSISLA
jgi:hypothetical protein